MEQFEQLHIDDLSEGDLHVSGITVAVVNDNHENVQLTFNEEKNALSVVVSNTNINCHVNWKYHVLIADITGVGDITGPISSVSMNLGFETQEKDGMLIPKVNIQDFDIQFDEGNFNFNFDCSMCPGDLANIILNLFKGALLDKIRDEARGVVNDKVVGTVNDALMEGYPLTKELNEEIGIGLVAVNPRKPLVIGIAGGTASGKSTLCQQLIDKLGIEHYSLLTMDNFYKALSKEQVADVANYNFDSPNALDFEATYEALSQLVKSEDAYIPDYDFSQHNPTDKKLKIKSSHIIIFEGIFAFHDERIRNLIDLKIFVDEDPTSRLMRRMKRDMTERGRTLDLVLHQWQTTVAPSDNKYLNETIDYSDIIIHGNSGNAAMLNLVASSICQTLKQNIALTNTASQ